MINSDIFFTRRCLPSPFLITSIATQKKLSSTKLENSVYIYCHTNDNLWLALVRR